MVGLRICNLLLLLLLFTMVGPIVTLKKNYNMKIFALFDILLIILVSFQNFFSSY